MSAETVEPILSAPGETLLLRQLVNFLPACCAAGRFQGTLVIRWKLGSETLYTRVLLLCDKQSSACSVHLTRASGRFPRR